MMTPNFSEMNRAIVDYINSKIPKDTMPPTSVPSRATVSLSATSLFLSLRPLTCISTKIAASLVSCPIMPIMPLSWGCFNLFYRTQIKSVTDYGAVDMAGKKLQFMGYLPVKAGDWVFTDGRFIFGNVPPRGSPATFGEDPSGKCN